MKNLLSSINWDWLKEFKIYIWGVVISATVFFLKGLLTGDRQSCDQLKKATNEGIHLKQSLRGQGIQAHLKAGISYCLYGLRCVIDKAEPVIMFAGSVFVISYFKKNPYLIDTYFLFNKLPAEFQELKPSVPASIGAICAVCVNKLLRLIKSPLPSSYTLPASRVPETEEVKDKQISATQNIAEYERNVNANEKMTEKDKRLHHELPSQYHHSSQFNTHLLHHLREAAIGEGFQ